MKTQTAILIPVFALIVVGYFQGVQGAIAAESPGAPFPPIALLDPPEEGFFSKQLDFHGILIKAHKVVADEALYEAYNRIALELAHLPMVVSNLAAAGAELHIIGRDQVTTDLPEWQHDKHVPLYEPTYNGLTRDRRTRGMGGLITSCGEENLLKLPDDRYRGRDICLHEFAHNIEGSGIPRSVRARFDEQYQKSKEKGLWLNSYAGSNPNEYFSELTMWYFGTHGDMNMTGAKPENGPAGLKKYDPDAYALFDDFYSGRIPIDRVEPRFRRPPGGGSNRQRVSRSPAAPMVSRLKSYKVGETRLSELLADAGMTGPTDEGIDGWHVARLDAAAPQGETTSPGNATDSGGFRVSFRNSGYRDASVADLEFKAGVLSDFKWNN